MKIERTVISFLPFLPLLLVCQDHQEDLAVLTDPKVPQLLHLLVVLCHLVVQTVLLDQIVL